MAPSTDATVIVETKKENHSDWIVPRRVMCAFFWIGIILLFTGIILLVTSKHKGGIFQSWGAILLGLGFCLLLICLILCLHAYCVITITEDQPQIKKTIPASPPSTIMMNGRKPKEFTGNENRVGNGRIPNGRRVNDKKPLQVIVIEKDPRAQKRSDPGSPRLAPSGTLLTDSRSPVQTVIPPGGMHTDHHIECRIPTSSVPESLISTAHNPQPDGASSPSSSNSPPEAACRCSRNKTYVDTMHGMPITSSIAFKVNADGSPDMSSREMAVTMDNEENMHRDSLRNKQLSEGCDQDDAETPLMLGNSRVLYSNPNSRRYRKHNSFSEPNGGGSSQCQACVNSPGDSPSAVIYSNPSLMRQGVGSPQVRPSVGHLNNYGPGLFSNEPEGSVEIPPHLMSKAYFDAAPNDCDYADLGCNNMFDGQDLQPVAMPCSPMYNSSPSMPPDPWSNPTSPMRIKPPIGYGVRTQRSDVTVRHGLIHSMTTPPPPRSLFTNIPPQDAYHPRPTRLPLSGFNPEIHPPGSIIVPSPGNPRSQPVVVYMNPMEFSESKISIYDNVQYAWSDPSKSKNYTTYSQGSKTFADI